MIRKHQEEVLSPGGGSRRVVRWSLEQDVKAHSLTILPFTTQFAQVRDREAPDDGPVVIARLAAPSRAGEPAVAHLRLLPDDALFWHLLEARSGEAAMPGRPGAPAPSRFSPWHNLVFSTVVLTVPIKVAAAGAFAQSFKRRATAEGKNACMKIDMPYLTNAVDLPAGAVLDVAPGQPPAVA